MESPKAPFLSYIQLVGIAEKFRLEHKSADNVPVPIDAIAEFGNGHGAASTMDTVIRLISGLSCSVP